MGQNGILLNRYQIHAEPLYKTALLGVTLYPQLSVEKNKEGLIAGAGIVQKCLGSWLFEGRFIQLVKIGFAPAAHV